MQHTPQMEAEAAIAARRKDRLKRSNELRADRKREQKRIGKTKRIIVK